MLTLLQIKRRINKIARALHLKPQTTRRVAVKKSRRVTKPAGETLTAVAASPVNTSISLPSPVQIK